MNFQNIIEKDYLICWGEKLEMFVYFPAPYLAIFEQGGSADIFSLITGGAEMTLLRAL